VPEDVAREYCIFPVDRIGNIITVAVANPFDVLKLDDIRIITGCQLRTVVSTAEEIEKIRGKGYQREHRERRWHSWLLRRRRRRAQGDRRRGRGRRTCPRSATKTRRS
jgi:hypothetical protein